MSDVVQQTSEALVAILDAAPAVLALTGRAAGADNIVAWVEDEDAPMLVPALPILAYAFLGDALGPIQNTRALRYRLIAAARDASVASALAETAVAALTYAALAAALAPAGLDAFVLSATRSQDAPETAAQRGGTPGVHRHDLDLVLVV